MKRAFLIAAVLSLIFSCTTGRESYVLPEHTVTVQSSSDKATEGDIQRVYEEALRSLDSICKTLEIEGSFDIHIMITDEGICKARNGYMSLPIWHVKNRKAAITHEITHLITGHDYNRFYAEGLAVFFQERFGEDAGFPNFEGRDLDDLLKERKSEYIPLTELYGNNTVFRAIGTKEREMAYIEAGAFMTYLYKEYGRKSFRKLHDGTPLSFEGAYGKDLETLEREWKKSLATFSFKAVFIFHL